MRYMRLIVATLLEITDIRGLTSQEKQTRVSDLLMSSSGAYLESGEESLAMARLRPLS